MPDLLAVSPNVSFLRESATIAVSQRARTLKAQGHAIIDLGAGEPDFDTPEFIREAAKLALDHGATRYTAVDGIVPLRQAIAARASEEVAHVDPVRADEVVVSTGSKQSLFNACFALFGPGDEVIIPTPAWTSYYDMVALARATAVPLHGDPTCDFKVTPELIEQAATERTRGVMLNSPSNPTGAVYTASELADLLEVADRLDLWVISDEIYRRIAYDGQAAGSLASAKGRERLIVVDGVAKAYAMTGWRIGWAIAPAPIARAMTALQSHSTSNATTVAQHAALAALTNRAAADRAVDHMVSQYRRRRDAAVALFEEGSSPRLVRPDGAFYLFFDVSDAVPGDPSAGSVFAERLLVDHGVAVVPGAAFRTPGWIRISYAAPEEQVVEGVRRALELWRSMSRGGR
jgi:aspartate aminotransferase